jgi:polyhydroxyalkanoate synthase subunit PhaC
MTPQLHEADDDLAVPLDTLLASVGRVAHTRLLPGREALSLLGALARRPRTTRDRLLRLAVEYVAILAGTSDTAPSSRDRRFADPAWTENPVLRRVLQCYLATGETALHLVDDAELDDQMDKRLRLLVGNLVDALSPSNNVLLNPEATKAIIDTRGANLVRGTKALVIDLSRRARVPSMVDTSTFEVGRNVGATPGAVVFRTPVFELIQYAPQTSDVREIPMLMVPPTINKFYMLDLAPGRSMVEHLLQNDQQIFMVSWRNPTARHADWNLDTYVHAVLEALDAVREITQSERAAVLGTCSGGIITSMAAGYLSAIGRGDEVAALTLLVTVLDQARAGTTNALLDRSRADAASALSRRIGYLDGSVLAEVFAWLRPNDLIWNYWVNNYLLGKKPPAFDVLFWNADTTRMPAALHRDFLELSLENMLVTPGEAVARGVPVDLGKITTDAYVVAGVADHITPWQSCYQTTRLLGGKTDFVLSTSGHIAALVNPPSNPKASFQTSTDNPASPADFAAYAEARPGSWWTHYSSWITARTGALRPAPPHLGHGSMQPLAEAPGTYVFDS